MGVVKSRLVAARLQDQSCADESEAVEAPAGPRLVRLAGAVEMSASPSTSQPGVWVAMIEHGSAFVEVDGTKRRLDAADVWVSERPSAVKGVGVYGWMLTVAVARLTGVTIEDPLVAPVAGVLIPGIYRLGGTQRSRFSAFFEALAGELELGTAADQAAVRALLELIVLCCVRAQEVTPAAPAAARSTAQRLATEILGVIDRRFVEPLSLSDVASELARSPASVARAARAATGSTVLELIADRRMGEARALLADSDLSIAEIAARVGFSSVGHFHRTFRRSTKTTPRRWRSDARRVE
jgi:AraC-like DNA-binding protein